MEAQQEGGRTGGGSRKAAGGTQDKEVGGKIRTWLRAVAKGGRRNIDGAICDGSGS